jgi:succinoglycan biosynthesis protein ExoM
VFDTVGTFDERFGLTGGGDTHFFLRASLQGYRTVWADEAIVREFVPATRATMGWLLRRSFRYGTTWSFCERELWPGRRVRARRLGREVKNIARGLMALPGALAGGKVPTVRCLQGLCEAAGNLSGMMGIRYEEYRPSRWMRAHPRRRRTARA